MTEQSSGVEIAGLFAKISADVQEYAKGMKNVRADLTDAECEALLRDMAAVGMSVGDKDEILGSIHSLIGTLRERGQ